MGYASYYRPTEREMMSDYLKAVDLLTSDGGEAKLLRKVEELKDVNKNSEYIIRAKLEDRDKKIEYLTKKYDNDIIMFKDAMRDM